MSIYSFLIEDEDSNKVFIERLERRLSIARKNILDIKELDSTNLPSLIIIDINLTTPQNIKILEEFLPKHEAIPAIFILSQTTNQAFSQADKMGASQILVYPEDTDSSKIREHKLNVIHECIQRTLKNTSTQEWSHMPEEDRVVLKTFGKVNNLLNQNILDGVPLPKEEITDCCNDLVDNLNNHCIMSWLNNIKGHHSYTHRHCLSVTGLAIAFGTHFQMNKAELQRLALSALLHDVGKVSIPLNVLDKPGRLSDQEVELIKTHPGSGADILRKDEQFDKDIIDIALHHHELLDGSGYPDGIGGSDIPDGVRMMTIIDIFSALVDERSYKKGLEWQQAYEIMEHMGDKLDQDLLKAFKPIAINMPDTKSQVAIFANSLSAT